MSKNQLQVQLNKLHEDKLSLFKMLDSIDHEQLFFKKSTAAWSVMQVLVHLRDAEIGTIRYMKKKLSDRDSLIDTTWRSARNSVLLQIALYSPMKFKAPKVVSNPEVNQDYLSLKAEYLEIDKELNELVGLFDQDLMSKAVFKHPFAGRLDIIQTLKFKRAHLHHHKKQIKRILK